MLFKRGLTWLLITFKFIAASLHFLLSIPAIIIIKTRQRRIISWIFPRRNHWKLNFRQINISISPARIPSLILRGTVPRTILGLIFILFPTFFFSNKGHGL